MSEECIEPGCPESKARLVCSGIWGGIRDRDQSIGTDGLAASIYSLSCDGGKGGDIYYVGACKGCKLTRVAVADVVGHGQAVSDVSQFMYDSLKAHICDPDSGRILLELNHLASRQGLKAMTTAAIVAYSGISAEVILSLAGHPPVLLNRRGTSSWSAAGLNENCDISRGPNAGLPLAVEPDTAYGQQVIPVTSGDRLFVYTDGVTEAPNPAGELFGVRRLAAVLDTNAGSALGGLKSAVLRALREHTGNGLTHDDVTLIAMAVR